MGRRKHLTRRKSVRKLRNEKNHPILQKAALPSGDWQECTKGDSLYLSKVAFSKDWDESFPPTWISHSLVIDKSGLAKLFVLGRSVEIADCKALGKFSTDITYEEFPEFLAFLDTTYVCPGNCDEKFLQMAKRQNKAFLQDKVVDSHPILYKGDHIHATMRSHMCEMITLKPDRRCAMCQKLRKLLNIYYGRWQKGKAKTPSSSTRNSFLSTPQRRSKFEHYRKLLRIQKRSNARLRGRIEKCLAKESIEVQKDLSDELEKIVTENSDEINNAFPENSFQRIFWNQQKQAMRAKSPEGRRWHPVMIRWAMSLRMQSPSAYRSLRTSGFFELPSERTLNDYIHFYDSSSGFHSDLNVALAAEAGVSKLTEVERYVALSFDEMRIRENLVFDKHSWKVVGFLSLGNVNDQLKQLANDIKTSSSSKELRLSADTVATHVLVFMIRGIITSLKFPYAHFLTSDLSAEYLYEIAWEAIRQIELIGLKVLSLTCDGAAVNRKFFRMNAVEEQSSSENIPIYKTTNFYSREGRPIFFICDVPHLVKTTRNCLSHSFPGAKQRCMMMNEKYITWEHLIDLYTKHSKIWETSKLYLTKKLKREHIYLDSYSRMRVDLAAQTMSATVASAMEIFQIPGAEETIRFLRLFDRAFDCLNVRSLHADKPERNGYRDSADNRLHFLKHEFLGYLQQWEDWIESKGELTETDKSRLCLSKETMTGWKITVNSFLEMVPLLFASAGAEEKIFILSERLSQDSVENYFGTLRQKGGRNTNPSAKEVLDASASVRVQRSIAQAPFRGNSTRMQKSRKKLFADIDLSAPVPKRIRKK